MKERKPLREGDRPSPGADWIKTDWFCMHCGARDVWQRSDEIEDHYHDCGAVCHTCDGGMCCVGKEEP